MLKYYNALSWFQSMQTNNYVMSGRGHRVSTKTSDLHIPFHYSGIKPDDQIWRTFGPVHDERASLVFYKCGFWSSTRQGKVPMVVEILFELKGIENSRK